MKNNGKTTVIFVLFLSLAGCVNAPDPLVLRAFEFDRKAWEEDRRADLDAELVKARLAAFAAHERYARGGK